MPKYYGYVAIAVPFLATLPVGFFGGKAFAVGVGLIAYLLFAGVRDFVWRKPLRDAIASIPRENKRQLLVFHAAVCILSLLGVLLVGQVHGNLALCGILALLLHLFLLSVRISLPTLFLMNKNPSHE